MAKCLGKIRQFFIENTRQGFGQGTLKGEVSLYCWPPVWLVWNQLYDNWQFLFLFAKQVNPNRRSTVQRYFPALAYLDSLVAATKKQEKSIKCHAIQGAKLRKGSSHRHLKNKCVGVVTEDIFNFSNVNKLWELTKTVRPIDNHRPRNTKRGSIAVPLTSCLTCLD